MPNLKVDTEPLLRHGEAVAKARRITSENTVFVIISFEGPDAYSLAGGLGVRVQHLSTTVAGMGFTTHLFFIGDPRLPGEEARCSGKLILHRWCQWISERYPNGVYDGEEEKLDDFTESVPKYVEDAVIVPALAAGRLVVVLGEEWQTTEAMCRLSDALHSRGQRDRALLFWNANNTFSFNRINWERLKLATTITTVSRYMKHVMWTMGVNPLVVLNGIPRSLLGRVDDNACQRLKTAVDAELLLCKVARWDPDKRWQGALEATARLKEPGLRTMLLARGGNEPYGREVMRRARALGLAVADAKADWDSHGALERALRDASRADVINFGSPLPPSCLRLMYRAADGVLANSRHEPFGIVGLEAMAAGGVAFTGCTGEDYAIPFVNCFVLETSNPMEIVDYVTYLKSYPEESARIRRAATQTARYFTWDVAVRNLISKLENQARTQEALAGKAKPTSLPDFEVEHDMARSRLSPLDESAVWALDDGPANRLAAGHSVDNGIQNLNSGRREAMVRTLKQDVERRLSTVPEQYVFRCHDGRNLRDLSELAEALTLMSDKTFAYHSNQSRSDFGNWVRDILGDLTLARALDKAQDRTQAAKKVAERVSFLKKKLP